MRAVLQMRRIFFLRVIGNFRVSRNPRARSKQNAAAAKDTVSDDSFLAARNFCSAANGAMRTEKIAVAYPQAAVFGIFSAVPDNASLRKLVIVTDNDVFLQDAAVADNGVFAQNNVVSDNRIVSDFAII